MFVFGTRPEAIKLAPLILAFKKQQDKFDTRVCVSAQHREMLDQVMDFFELESDHDLDLMQPGQSLFDITAKGLKALESVLDIEKPDVVFVQGDTTTAFIGALAAFYKQIKVAHVEAGLRSGDKYSPFPEEMNRLLAGRLADYHFTPTPSASKNLELEAMKGEIFMVGNTVIDALMLGLDLINNKSGIDYSSKFDFLGEDDKIVLITGHRRESFGEPFEELCSAIRDLALEFPDVRFVYPVHLNPNVREPVNRILSDLKNINLIEPLDYPHFLWLMNRSYLVLTDSGGLQEEAPSLGKPVLVMRDVTERTEGIEAGTAKLVGTSRKVIVEEARVLLADKNAWEKMAKAVNPYGDGHSCDRIVKQMEKTLFNQEVLGIE